MTIFSVTTGALEDRAMAREHAFAQQPFGVAWDADACYVADSRRIRVPERGELPGRCRGQFHASSDPTSM